MAQAIIMVDSTDPEPEPSPIRSRYNPDRDRKRMRAYMADVRTKNKAGYKHLTVGQWKKLQREEGGQEGEAQSKAVI